MRNMLIWKTKARADGGRRFQREGPATAKDLDLAIVVLVSIIHVILIHNFSLQYDMVYLVVRLHRMLVIMIMTMIIDHFL